MMPFDRKDRCVNCSKPRKDHPYGPRTQEEEVCPFCLRTSGFDPHQDCLTKGAMEAGMKRKGLPARKVICRCEVAPPMRRFPHPEFGLPMLDDVMKDLVKLTCPECGESFRVLEAEEWRETVV